MPHATDVVEILDSLGYFAQTPPELKATAENRLATTIHEHRQFGSDFDDNGYPLDHRCFHVDGENLREGLASSIEMMSPTLEIFGVVISSATDEPIDQFGLATVINGERFVVFEWPNQQPEDLDTWNISHKRLVEILNLLLERAGARERLYAISGYNDARVVYLTEDMHQAIVSNAHLFDDEFLPRPESAMTEHPEWS